MHRSHPLALLVACVTGCFLLGIVSCASSASDVRAVLVSSDILAAGAWDVARPYYQETCQAKAQTCFETQDEVCLPKVECQQARQRLADKIVGIHEMARAGMIAIEAAEQTRDKTLGEKVRTLLLVLMVRRSELIDTLKGSPLWTRLQRKF